MKRFDRYLFARLLLAFGFFSLILVAVFWINSAVQLFDRIIGDGQSALVFLEFSILGMPRLITTVLPIATFAATVFVINRLSTESELTVMSATGASPWRIARPVVFFGLFSASMMSALTHDLVPRATAQLAERETELSQNVTARLLQDGTFLSPIEGVTFYMREIDAEGVLRDVFVADRRNPERHRIHTAAESYLLRKGETASLIMVDGLTQDLSIEGNRLATARFRDFTFDISSLMSRPASIGRDISELGTRALLATDQNALFLTGVAPGLFAEEAHTRFARAAFCFVTALVAFSILISRSYSRFGIWQEIVIAFVILLVLDGMRSTLSESVIQNADLWPVLYIPALLGGAISLALLAFSSSPSIFRRPIEAAE